jgi:hypothetical protein
MLFVNIAESQMVCEVDRSLSCTGHVGKLPCSLLRTGTVMGGLSSELSMARTVGDSACHSADCHCPQSFGSFLRQT